MVAGACHSGSRPFWWPQDSTEPGSGEAGAGGGVAVVRALPPSAHRVAPGTPLAPGRRPGRLFDLGSREEAAADTIPGALNIPVSELEGALQMDAAAFQALYSVEKPKLEDENLIFFCQMGKRGLQATQLAQGLGYRGACNYAGTYREWFQKGVGWSPSTPCSLQPEFSVASDFQNLSASLERQCLSNLTSLRSRSEFRKNWNNVFAALIQRAFKLKEKREK